MTDLQQEIEQRGYAVLPGLFGAERVARLVSELDAARLQLNGSVLQSRGQGYGIRDLVEVWPTAIAVAREPGLHAAIGSVLPQGFGPVRSIFFDKPPDRTWSLPWPGPDDRRPGAQACRRVPPADREGRLTLHVEFAPERALPAGLAWHRFLGMTP